MPTPFPTGLQLWLDHTSPITRDYGQALNNTATTYLSHADDATLSLAGTSWEITFWFRMNAASTVNYWNIVAQYFDTGNQRSYIIFVDPTNHLNCEISTDGTFTPAKVATATTFGPLSGATYYWGRVQYDIATGILSISVNDGALDTAGPFAGGVFDSNEAFNIGRGNRTNNFPGQIHDVIIWKRLLDATDTATIYGAGVGLGIDEIADTRPSLLDAIAYWDLVEPHRTVGAGRDDVMFPGSGQGLGQTGSPTNVATGGGRDAINQWDDQSPNGFDAVQATQINRPSLRRLWTTALSPTVLGYRAPYFNGNVTYMTHASLNLGTTHHLFVVVRTTKDHQTWTLLGNSSSVDIYGMQITQTRVRYRPSGVAAVEEIYAFPFDVSVLVEIVRVGTAVAFYVDGAQIGVTQTLAANNALTVDSIGAFNGGNPTAPGYIPAILLYDAILTGNDRAQTQEYLAEEMDILVAGTWDETGLDVDVLVILSEMDTLIVPPFETVSGWRQGMASRLQRSDFSRMWLIEGRAGPANVPQYENFWKAGAPTWSFGDVTNQYVPDPGQYGQFDVAGVIIGERGNPQLPVTARYLADSQSVLLQLARAGCDSDLHIHFGLCKDPRDFNAGWDKILVLEAARITQWGATDMGAMMPGDRAMVNEEVPFTGQDMYEILPIAFQEQAASQAVQEVVDITICDTATCGDCGIPSDGCQHVFAVTLSNGGSPGLPAEVIFTQTGGAVWDETGISTLSPTEDPNALACVSPNLVVVSEDSESLHYAPIADILAGTETWAEVTTGFVATKGPTDIFSADPAHTWIVAEGGYIYFTADPTAGVEVQDPGVVTTEDYAAINGIDSLNIVAVGANNSVVATFNGGETWEAITGPNVGVALTTVWMLSDRNWFVGCADGTLYYTLDSGDSWTIKAFPGSGTGVVRDIAFSSPTVGWMAHSTATPAGRILRTINGGFSWYVAPENNGAIPTNDYVGALAACPENVNVIYGAGLAGNGTDGFIVKGA